MITLNDAWLVNNHNYCFVYILHCSEFISIICTEFSPFLRKNKQNNSLEKKTEAKLKPHCEDRKAQMFFPVSQSGRLTISE